VGVIQTIHIGPAVIHGPAGQSRFLPPGVILLRHPRTGNFVTLDNAVDPWAPWQEWQPLGARALAVIWDVWMEPGRWPQFKAVRNVYGAGDLAAAGAAVPSGLE
jgi:hypothetical protein